MVSNRILITINISLALIIFLLVLNLVGVDLPTLGQAQYLFDDSDPICIVNWRDDYTPWNDLDRCCLEARKQFDCKRQKNTVQQTDYSCGSENSVKYLLNSKAYNYCKQLPIW